MAKFPISKKVLQQSGFAKNFPHLFRVSRTASNNPYTYGQGTTQLGKLNKFNQMEYLPSVGIGEAVYSGISKKNIKYWFYGTNQLLFNLNNLCLPELENGIVDLYIVDNLDLPEFCEVTDTYEDILESKRILITNENTNDYTWENGNIIIHHNFDGIVDYVLRYKNLERIIVRDDIIDNDNLKIYFPPQLTITDDEYYELIIYKISEIPNKTNVFSYKIYNKSDFKWIDNNCIISNNLNSIVIDSILRSSLKNRILFHSIITSPNEIKYIFPENYSSILDYICVYKSKLSQTFLITENNTENVFWTTVDGNLSVIIKHDLNSIVNIVLRNLEKSMFKYSDYIIDENTIQLIFPETTNKITRFFIDLYSIYK